MPNNPEPTQQPSQLDPHTWVDTYGNYLYRFALGRLHNTIEAENVVQETFLAALKAKDRFAGQSSERTWLTGILKHKIIDHMRKSYREKPVSTVKGDTETIDNFFDRQDHLKKAPGEWALHPDELVEKKEFWKTFSRCKEQLPPATADAFTLREIDKLPGKEICDILNITPSNFWIMLHRARLQLRTCLEKNWFEKDKH